MDIIQHSPIWHRLVDRAFVGKEQEMKEEIKDLIESYQHKLDEIERDLPEQKFCNSYLKGMYSAIHMVIDDLQDLIEGSEE